MIPLHGTKLMRFAFCNIPISLSLHKGKVNLIQWKSCSFLKCTSRTFSFGVSPNPTSGERSPRNILTEMEYYRSILESNDSYADTLWNDSMLNRNNKSKNNLLLATRDMLCERKDSFKQKLVNLKRLVTNEKNQLKYDEMLEVVYLLGTTNSQYSDLIDILKMLDNECYKRIISYNANEMLLLGDVWCHTYYRKKAQYIWKMSLKLFDSIHSLTHSQIVQTFYSLSLYRRFPPLENPHILHSVLVNVIPNLTLDEIAIVCLGYFKTENKAHPQHMVCLILDKTANEVNSCSSHTLGVLAKYLYSTLYPGSYPSVNLLLNRIAENSSKFRITTLIKSLSIGISREGFNEQLTEYVLNQLKNNMSTVRMKDIDRMLFVMASFNLVDKEFFSAVITEFEKNVRDNEIHTFPEAFLSIVNYLITFGIFPEKFIAKVLSKEYYENLKDKQPGNNRGRRELAFIDIAVEIENPHYNGPRLLFEDRKKILKLHEFMALDKKTYVNKIAKQIEEHLISMYKNEDSISREIILPHYAVSCIVSRLDKRLKPQPIPESFKVFTPGRYKKAPDDGHVWLAFIVLRNLAYSLGDKPNAVTEAKLRHLRMLGYVPVCVDQGKWDISYREYTEKQYLKDLIEKAVVVKGENLENK